MSFLFRQIFLMQVATIRPKKKNAILVLLALDCRSESNLRQGILLMVGYV